MLIFLHNLWSYIIKSFGLKTKRMMYLEQEYASMPYLLRYYSFSYRVHATYKSFGAGGLVNEQVKKRVTAVVPVLLCSHQCCADPNYTA